MTVLIVPEAMAPELEDFRQRGVFSAEEVRSIVQRRREHDGVPTCAPRRATRIQGQLPKLHDLNRTGRYAGDDRGTAEPQD